MITIIECLEFSHIFDFFLSNRSAFFSYFFIDLILRDFCCVALDDSPPRTFVSMILQAAYLPGPWNVFCPLALSLLLTTWHSGEKFGCLREPSIRS